MISTVVFDAYGTLLDVHSAMARHAGRLGNDWADISAAWRIKQLEYSWVRSLAGPAQHRDFWTLTRDALDYVARRYGIDDAPLLDALMDDYRVLSAYPDAAPVLAALRARGLRTAILSNGSPAMLAAAVEAAQLGPYLDAVLSVDAVRVYKPRPEVYRLVTERFGVAPSDVVFVSSNRWDVMGARTFGFRAAWVNRAGLPDEYPDLAPTEVLTELGGIIALA
jgi:2-haloacid dehalogenase